MTDERLHGFDRLAAVERTEQLVVLLDVVAEQQLFVSRAALAKVYRREDPLIGHLPIEHDFGVPRPLELFEDHLVHPAARLDERRGDDGEGTTPFDVASRTEDFPRDLEGARIEPTGHRPPAAFHVKIERTTQARE